MKSDLANFMELNPYSKKCKPDLIDLKGMELEELQNFCVPYLKTLYPELQ